MDKCSCGIICLNKQNELLLCKRRDTYEYQLIIFGKYTVTRLERLINFVSPKERTRILTYTFEEMWDDLWVIKTGNYHTCFERAKNQFIQHETHIKTLLLTVGCSRYMKHFRWGFPKGKPNDREQYSQCALREFEEETRIRKNTIKVIEKCPPVRITYQGTDNCWYRSLFWFYRLPNKTRRIKPMTTESNIRTFTHSEEVSKIKWVPLVKVIKYLPPNLYNAWKTQFPESCKLCVKHLDRPPGLTPITTTERSSRN